MATQRTILVTGGAGFIGSNFIHYINKTEPEIFIVNLYALTYAANLDNLKSLSALSKYKFIYGNICDEQLVYDLIRDYEVPTIVHFVEDCHIDRSIYNPQSFIETDILGTFFPVQTARTLDPIDCSL